MVFGILAFDSSFLINYRNTIWGIQLHETNRLLQEFQKISEYVKDIVSKFSTTIDPTTWSEVLNSLHKNSILFCSKKFWGLERLKCMKNIEQPHLSICTLACKNCLSIAALATAPGWWLFGPVQCYLAQIVIYLEYFF